MAVTHQWIVPPTVKTKTVGEHNDVVYKCELRLNSHEEVDGKRYYTNASFSIILDTSDLTNFTAFADLTEAQVLGWAKATKDANAAAETGDEIRWTTCAQSEADAEAVIAKKQATQTNTQVAPWGTTGG